MLVDDVARASERLAATASRNDKRDIVAELLRRTPPSEVPTVVAALTGEPRQGRVGVGWATLRDAAAVSGTEGGNGGHGVPVQRLDEVLDRLAALGGGGSAAERRRLLSALLADATPAEAGYVARLLGGEVRHGASEGVLVEAVAAAWEVPAASVRRAVMFGGDVATVAGLAATGGAGAVADVRLVPGRPVRPMLASGAPDAADAVATTGPASVEWKLDGIRIQVHRSAGRVRVWSRNLNELTGRLPGVVAAAEALPGGDVVVDGEALRVGRDGRPALFQDSVRRDDPDGGHLRPFLFDVLHVDGVDLVDEPLAARIEVLDERAADLRPPAVATGDPVAAADVLEEAVAAGHEGVVVKALSSTYQAGRRGRGWLKVKPVHTLDLVVVAVEWGHGRRTGWLSNLHLAARGADGRPVMVGKTFKGLSDELLRWQTRRLGDLAEGEGRAALERRRGVVTVRPELVVEVAVDGVQRSTRYPGGVALRFARVVRYREDKTSAEADDLDAVRSLMAGD